MLEDVRDHFGKPVSIYSGCRCDKYNKYVGGSKGSKHKQGRASDIGVKDTPPSEVYNYLVNKYPGKYGIGNYATFTHIDTRANQARWRG